jgi:hypothetical protein
VASTVQNLKRPEPHALASTLEALAARFGRRMDMEVSPKESGRDIRNDPGTSTPREGFRAALTPEAVLLSLQSVDAPVELQNLDERRVIAISRYSPGNTIVPSSERFMVPISARISRFSAF